MTADYMHDPERHDKSARITTVEFYKDALFAVERQDGVFVAITPICNALGVDAKRQRDRIQRDPILSEGGTMVALPSAGGIQETFCLRLDLVHGWLFTIDDSRVRDEETRQKVLTYKRECHGALFHHFYGRRDLPVNELEESDAPKVRMVTEARHTFGVPAAAQLWLELRLPVVPAMLHTPGQGELMEFRRAAAE
jgi:hypothetical protein